MDRLKHVELEENEKLRSFDVVSVYPSIPIQLGLDALKKWLEKNDVNPEKIKEYVELVNLCLSQTTFYFNNEVYEQIDGLMMGNPISSLISELVMSDFECRAIKEYPHIFRYWSRFVDYVLEILREHHIHEALNYTQFVP